MISQIAEVAVPRGNLIQLSDRPFIAALDAVAAVRGSAVVKMSERDHIQPGPVCIIDDDDWVCDSMKTLLETYGFEVIAYNSAKEFLDDKRRIDVKCLIVDQHMPGLDGLDVTAELHRQGLYPPTILITGRVDVGITRRADALGIRAVLEKPFPAARLVGLIRGALGPPG